MGVQEAKVSVSLLRQAPFQLVVAVVVEQVMALVVALVVEQASVALVVAVAIWTST